MIIISIDLGTSRTGIAVCDKYEMLASPITVINEKSADLLAMKINEYIKNTKAELIIIGLPKNMDGSYGNSCKNVYNFSKILKKYTDVKIEFWDERKTTVSATNYLNITNTKGKKRKGIIDAVSAVIILQNYLDYRKNNIS